MVGMLFRYVPALSELMALGLLVVATM